MSLLWLIIWFGSILAAVIAFAVTAWRENARARSAVAARQPKTLPVSEMDDMPQESLENLDSFPAESFDFDDGTLK